MPNFAERTTSLSMPFGRKPVDGQPWTTDGIRPGSLLSRSGRMPRVRGHTRGNSTGLLRYGHGLAAHLDVNHPSAPLFRPSCHRVRFMAHNLQIAELNRGQDKLHHGIKSRDRAGLFSRRAVYWPTMRSARSEGGGTAMLKFYSSDRFEPSVHRQRQTTWIVAIRIHRNKSGGGSGNSRKTYVRKSPGSWWQELTREEQGVNGIQEKPKQGGRR